jgi:alpha-amylase/alpha-mannosidase (GH57 family)
MPIKTFSIHGHFYQPPREDPLTGIIPHEPGAAPYNNWNERILDECYLPNARLNNYQKISFNVGPTLFSWLEGQDPYTYGEILSQDQANYGRYGIGNAIAQAYNHTILPLASSSDKRIQIKWGIADFIHRFGHHPQGMWLPETAVDYEVLSLLANHGIEFTILAPWQADEDGLDPTAPYRVLLPGGNSIVAFFYNRDLSTRISFTADATANADQFAIDELYPIYQRTSADNPADQFILVVSDGELYGHHQPFRELFLSHLLDGASAAAGLRSSYPGLWLKTHTVEQTIGIRERTSWSCHHGVARWTGECACTPHDGRWKSTLRYSLNRLAAALDSLYFESVYPWITKPRSLRERYIHVMLGEMKAERLVSELATRTLTSQQMRQVLLLLESQRERQRIFTSCGWFFEDFDRIEPKNVITYAAQAVRLAHLATGDDLAPQTRSDLHHVVSPVTGLRADQVFTQQLERQWEPQID